MYDIKFSLTALAYDLFELGRTTIADDDSIDLRQLKFWIINQRALWLRNEFNKSSRTIDEGFVQDLGCLKLEVADPSECCNVPTGCSILRTEMIIPQTIEQYQTPTFTRIGPINKTQINWKLVPLSQIPFVGNGRFNGRLIYPFLMNGRIYLKFSDTNMTAKMLEYINVRGVFEDPTELRNFTACNGTACYTDNDRFPLNRWLYDYLKDQVVKNNLLREMVAPTDKAGNASNDATVNAGTTTAKAATE